MKKKVLSFMTAMLMLFSVLCVSSAPSLEVYAANNTSYAKQVAGLVNKEREANGLSYVKYSDKLSQAAAKRAEEIVSTFSHTRPDGTSCFTIMDEYGIGYYTVGENIAMGQGSPSSVMNSWMNSSGHRANILNAQFNFIGIGAVKEGGRYYWVQLFAGSNSLSGSVILAGETTSTTTSTTTDPKSIDETESKATSKTTTKTTVKTTASTKATAKTTAKTAAKTTAKTTATTTAKTAATTTATTVQNDTPSTAAPQDSSDSAAATGTTAASVADGENGTTTENESFIARIIHFFKKLLGLA